VDKLTSGQKFRPVIVFPPLLFKVPRHENVLFASFSSSSITMVNSKSVSIGHASPGFLQRLRSLVEALFRAPPPLMGDGLNDADAQSSQAETGIIRDLISQGKRIPEDLDLLLEVLQTLRAKGLIDDRDYLVCVFPYHGVIHR